MISTNFNHGSFSFFVIPRSRQGELVPVGLQAGPGAKEDAGSDAVVEGFGGGESAEGDEPEATAHAGGNHHQEHAPATGTQPLPFLFMQ